MGIKGGEDDSERERGMKDRDLKGRKGRLLTCIADLFGLGTLCYLARGVIIVRGS